MRNESNRSFCLALRRFWVAQRFTAAIKRLPSGAAFSRRGMPSFTMQL